MTEMTPFQAVAKIRRIVDMPALRLPHGASDVAWRIEDEVIALKYQINKVSGRRGGETIKPQAQRMHTWRIQLNGTWEHDVVTVKPNAKGQYIASSGRTAHDEAERDTWARMCYRPGNAAAPMERGNI